MELRRTLLAEASAKGVISVTQADALWDFLAERTRDRPAFQPAHILYYLGGLVAIGAMTLFVTLGFERFGGIGLLVIALGYAAGGVALTDYLLRRGLAIPAGIVAAFVVALTPLAVYGLQSALGQWATGRVYRDYHVYIDWRWIMMELATIAAAAVALWRWRLPFLLMPLAVTLWYMSMDLTPFLFGQPDVTWALRKSVSLWFGLGVLVLALALDLRTRREDRDYAFWLYLFGMLAFWCGLSLMNSQSEIGKLGYLAINLLLIAIGALLQRRVFAVFGGIGVAGYLGHLAYRVFKDSMVFPFALTLIGLAVIGLGLLWQRHEKAIAARVLGWLPAPVADLVERRH
jgi:hypothetical protein